MVRVRCAAIRGLGAARNCGSWEPRNNRTYQPIAARQAVAFLVDGELTGCRVRSRIEAVDVPPIQRNPGLAPGVTLFCALARVESMSSTIPLSLGRGNRRGYVHILLRKPLSEWLDWQEKAAAPLEAYEWNWGPASKMRAPRRI